MWRETQGSGRLRLDETQDLVDGSRSSGRGQLDSLKRLAPSPSRLGSWQSTLPRLGQRFTIENPSSWTVPSSMRRCCTGQIVNGKGSSPPDSWCPLGSGSDKVFMHPRPRPGDPEFPNLHPAVFISNSPVEFRFPSCFSQDPRLPPKAEGSAASFQIDQSIESNAEQSYPSLSLPTFADRLRWSELGQTGSAGFGR